MKQHIATALDAPPSTWVFIVDVSSFVFRAYYATGGFTTSSGQPVGAVFGVANMLVSLLRDLEPAHLVAAMDSKTRTFRSDMYPAYKANRPAPPEDLVAQFPLVDELLEALDIPVLRAEGFEADDVVATVVRRCIEKGYKAVIVSGDKDLLQLVGPDTVMVDTMKGAVWDAEAVQKKWGVPPHAMGDLLALTGDSSDNIPGVPKVGPKTAAALLSRFSTLDGVYAHLDELKSKATAARLREHRDDALLSRRLVALRTDVDVPFAVEDAKTSGLSPERLLPFLQRIEARKLAERLFGDRAHAAAAAQSPQISVDYRTVDTAESLADVVRAIRAEGRCAVDLETTSTDAVQAEIVGVALAWKPHEGVYVPVGHRTGPNLPLDDVLAVLKPLLEDPSIGVVAQNAKYEDTILRRHGIRIATLAMDPMLASYLLQPDARSHGLDALAQSILGRRVQSFGEVTQKTRGSQLLFHDVSIADATAYAAEDAEVALCLADALGQRIAQEGLDTLLRDLEIPLCRVLCTMELTGVAVDADRLHRMSHQVGREIAEIEARAHAAAGRAFNLASPKQLQEILFDELGLPRQKKTKTGYSTDVEVLETLAPLHELPRLLLEHRTLSKLKNTYLDTLPHLRNPATGRIHTSFNQAVAATGRLSSSNPNLQNIPVRTPLGKEIRRAFVAPPGHLLMSADYSQIELRVLAHLSQDPELLAAYRNGWDIHERTARAVFGLPEGAPVSPEQRAAAKTVNFGVIYGKTPFSLAKELGISQAEAKHFIDTYFQRYPGVAAFLEETVAQARATGYAQTLLGRKRPLPQLQASNFAVRQHAERMAKNTPIQGTAADLLKIAMIAVQRRLDEGRCAARMILTVHDELVFEVPEDQVDATLDMVRTTMESAMDLSIPLVVDIGVADNWGDAH